MTVLQPEKQHPHSSALQFKKRRSQGVFISVLSTVCVCIGVLLGFSLRTIDNVSPRNDTFWQEKAAALEVEKPVVVTYTTPEAQALKAEMDELKKSFGRYATTRASIQTQMYGGAESEPEVKPVAKKAKPAPHQTTAELAGKIARNLLLDEVDSFLNKVQIVEEVRQHAVEVGF